MSDIAKGTIPLRERRSLTPAIQRRSIEGAIVSRDTDSIEATELKAGRELDALVAEKVMGWTTYTEYVHGPMMHGGADMLLYRRSEQDGDMWSVDGFNPSADMVAAWEVVDALTARKFYVCVEHVHKSRHSWNAWVGDKNASAETAPLAICLAALKSVESP